MKTTKRIVSALLCVLMIGGVLPLTSFAAYENTHVNTGNQIEDLIAVATTQIGYTEGNSTAGHGGTTGGSGNYTKYGAWYSINPGAWCAMFVSWCANQAGIPTSVIPKHASCDAGMQWFQNNGRWQWSKAVTGNTYQPKRGDIIYFRTKTNQVTDSTHVGIVYSSDSSTVYTIEGNTSNRCDDKSYSLSSAYILGYGTPAYSNVTVTYTTGTYQTTASSLNMRSGPGTSYSVLTTLDQGTTVTITEISGTWGKCTYGGYTGWISMKYCTPVAAERTYTITFDPNGGTITSGSESVQIKLKQKYGEVLSALPAAQRTGYTFDSWYCEKYDYKLGLDGVFSVEEDVTFKAIWVGRPGIYKVTTKGGTLNLRSAPNSADASVLAEISNGTELHITAFDGDWGFTTYGGKSGWVSLAYCTWVKEYTDSGSTESKAYTLTFKLNGGKMPAGYSTTYKFNKDELLASVIGGFPVPTREGYDFNGWRWDKAAQDTQSYRWTDGWGTQPYYANFGNATFVADWVTHEHSYSTTVTTPATCISKGVKTHTCYACGDSYTTEIATSGHAYGDFVVTTPATCMQKGVKTKTCVNCGETELEDIDKLDHSFTYSGGTVSCINGCGTRHNGWFKTASATYYCVDGVPQTGVIADGTDFYYADGNGAIVKNRIVEITEAQKNGKLGAGRYYSFDADGKLIKNGFVEYGSYTCYYKDAVLATGLTYIVGNHYYFYEDGDMARNVEIYIGGGQGVSEGKHLFLSDGKMQREAGAGEIKEENGKLYYVVNGEKQPQGLYAHDGKYYYAGSDGALVTDGVVYVYYTNNILERSYYSFGSDGALETRSFYKRPDGKCYYLDGSARHLSGFQKIGNDFYIFHNTNKEMYVNVEMWVGSNSYGITEGYYSFGSDGKMVNTSAAYIATVAADGAESAFASFEAQANDVQAVNTAPATALSAISSDNDDDEE